VSGKWTRYVAFVISDCGIVDPLSNAHWDELVASQPESSFFHGQAWARTLIASYGFEPCYIAALVGNRLKGCLPLMEANSRWFGIRGVSLPFTDVCPVLGSEQMSIGQLIQEAISLGIQRHWEYLELRVGQPTNELATAIPSQKHYGHELDITETIPQVFRRFDASVQRAIRKAEKSAVTCEISRDFQALSEFYALHCKTRKQHGLPPQPLAFFRQIQAHILAAHQGFIVLAKHQSQPIAGAVIFLFGSQGVYKYAASDPAFLQLRGNNLVLWTAIQHLKAMGAAKLHLGRTSFHDEGLRRFKKGWGTEEVTIQYYKFDLVQNQFVADSDRSRGWYNAVFSRLPVPLLKWLGAYCYRHLV
jgi:lipid II:glycine glycyltransferase (peptidoglycan interpeptide bridge formation enzyme)